MLSLHVVNLGKYNEGKIVGDWIEIPATEEEIQDLFVSIGIGRYDEEGEYVHGKEENGVFYEEYMITDVDFDLEYKQIDKILDIDQYSDLYVISEKAEILFNKEAGKCLLKAIKYYTKGDYDKCLDHLVGLLNDFDIDHDFMNDDAIEDYIKHNAHDGGWRRILYFLSDADTTSEWHYLDGYANLTKVKGSYIEESINEVGKAIIEKYL